MSISRQKRILGDSLKRPKASGEVRGGCGRRQRGPHPPPRQVRRTPGKPQPRRDLSIPIRWERRIIIPIGIVLLDDERRALVAAYRAARALA